MNDEALKNMLEVSQAQMKTLSQNLYRMSSSVERISDALGGVVERIYRFSFMLTTTLGLPRHWGHGGMGMFLYSGLGKTGAGGRGGYGKKGAGDSGLDWSEAAQTERGFEREYRKALIQAVVASGKENIDIEKELGDLMTQHRGGKRFTRGDIFGKYVPQDEKAEKTDWSPEAVSRRHHESQYRKAVQQYQFSNSGGTPEEEKEVLEHFMKQYDSGQRPSRSDVNDYIRKRRLFAQIAPPPGDEPPPEDGGGGSPVPSGPTKPGPGDPAPPYKGKQKVPLPKNADKLEQYNLGGKTFNLPKDGSTVAVLDIETAYEGKLGTGNDIVDAAHLAEVGVILYKVVDGALEEMTRFERLVKPEDGKDMVVLPESEQAGLLKDMQEKGESSDSVLKSLASFLNDNKVDFLSGHNVGHMDKGFDLKVLSKEMIAHGLDPAELLFRGGEVGVLDTLPDFRRLYEVVEGKGPQKGDATLTALVKYFTKNMGVPEDGSEIPDVPQTHRATGKGSDTQHSGFVLGAMMAFIRDQVQKMGPSLADDPSNWGTVPPAMHTPPPAEPEEKNETGNPLENVIQKEMEDIAGQIDLSQFSSEMLGKIQTALTIVMASTDPEEAKRNGTDVVSPEDQAAAVQFLGAFSRKGEPELFDSEILANALAKYRDAGTVFDFPDPAAGNAWLHDIDGAKDLGLKFFPKGPGGAAALGAMGAGAGGLKGWEDSGSAFDAGHPDALDTDSPLSWFAEVIRNISNAASQTIPSFGDALSNQGPGFGTMALSSLLAASVGAMLTKVGMDNPEGKIAGAGKWVAGKAGEARSGIASVWSGLESAFPRVVGWLNFFGRGVAKAGTGLWDFIDNFDVDESTESFFSIKDDEFLQSLDDKFKKKYAGALQSVPHLHPSRDEVDSIFEEVISTKTKKEEVLQTVEEVITETTDPVSPLPISVPDQTTSDLDDMYQALGYPGAIVSESVEDSSAPAGPFVPPAAMPSVPPINSPNIVSPGTPTAVPDPPADPPLGGYVPPVAPGMGGGMPPPIHRPPPSPDPDDPDDDDDKKKPADSKKQGDQMAKGFTPWVKRSFQNFSKSFGEGFRKFSGVDEETWKKMSWKEKVGAGKDSLFAKATSGFMVGSTLATNALQAGAPDMFATLQGSFQLLAGTIGQMLIPAAAWLSVKAQNLADWFADLSDTAKSTIGTVMGWGLGILATTVILSKFLLALQLLFAPLMMLKALLVAGGLSMVAGIIGFAGAIMAAVYALRAYRDRLNKEEDLKHKNEYDKKELEAYKIGSDEELRKKFNREELEKEAKAAGLSLPDYLEKKARDYQKQADETIRKPKEELEEHSKGNPNVFEFFGFNNKTQDLKNALHEAEIKALESLKKRNEMMRMFQLERTKKNETPEQKESRLKEERAEWDKRANPPPYSRDKVSGAQSQILYTLKGLRATPQYSSIEELYKKIQMTAISMDPLEVRIMKMQFEAQLEMVKQLAKIAGLTEKEREDIVKALEKHGPAFGP